MAEADLIILAVELVLIVVAAAAVVEDMRVGAVAVDLECGSRQRYSDLCLPKTNVRGLTSDLNREEVIQTMYQAVVRMFLVVVARQAVVEHSTSHE